jgi:hypothetical protein
MDQRGRSLYKKSRIVNGYEPKTRPWMVLLELHEQVPEPGALPRNSPQCGGAVINQVIGSLKLVIDKTFS